MKKTNDLVTMFGVRAAVFVLDGNEWWIYQSEQSWPSEMQHIVSMSLPLTSSY
jgi:hypothetical protein